MLPNAGILDLKCLKMSPLSLFKNSGGFSFSLLCSVRLVFFKAYAQQTIQIKRLHFSSQQGGKKTTSRHNDTAITGYPVGDISANAPALFFTTLAMLKCVFIHNIKTKVFQWLKALGVINKVTSRRIKQSVAAAKIKSLQPVECCVVYYSDHDLKKYQK